MQLEELKRKIVLGTEQIKQGSVTDGEVVFERLQAKIRSIAQENEYLEIGFLPHEKTPSDK
jgi:antitoxin ParD1/3/4